MRRDHPGVDCNRPGDALRRLVDLVSHRSGAALAVMSAASITLPQILLLSRVQRLGPASVSGIAEGSMASSPALSQMIERLVQQGLLDRSEDPVDRRRKAVRTTERAHALLRKLEAARSADYEDGLAPLRDDRRRQLAAALEQAVADLENGRAGNPPPRLPGKKESTR